MRDRGIGGKVFVPCDRWGGGSGQSRKGKSWHCSRPASSYREEDIP